MEEFFKTRRGLAVTLLIVVFFAFGFYTGSSHSTKNGTSAPVGSETPKDIDANFSSFWKVWNVIDEKYPNADKVSGQDRVYGAINGLVDSLDDPYSTFFEPTAKEIFEADISGNFSGIGAEIGQKDKILTVIAPLKDTPADKAGLKPGDRIVKIDGALTSGITTEEAISKIRGDAGTTVTLNIFREGIDDPFDVKIVRQVINIPTLDTEKRDDGIFIIKLYSFSADSAKLFRDAIREFADAKSDKLIVDLRGNPGGYLDAAVSISSWFLDGSKTVLIEDYGNEQEKKVYRSRGYDVFTSDLKFVILIDGGSASASEILAGAMQDHKKAILVGSQSYGKGSVQEVVDITPDTIFKITVANWLTPNENLITEKGLTPDYEVEFKKADVDAGRDPQLNKAVELLKNWPGIK